MESTKRVVLKIPVETLCDTQGELPIRRVRDLGAEEIKVLLAAGAVRFVIADVGKALEWFGSTNSFSLWKSEVRLHLAVPGFQSALETFPGSYCYVASEWGAIDGSAIILLEKLH